MFSLFKKKKQAVFYFQGFPPKERIDNFILQFLQPTFQEKGFEFKKSDFSFRRRSGIFLQTISFPRYHYNATDRIVRFEIFFSIDDEEYAKWHKAFYGLKAESKHLNTINAGNIANWNKEFMIDQWYDLVAVDNDILKDKICSNFEKAALPVLNDHSDRQYAILNFRRKSFYVSSILFDYCIMFNNREKAASIIKDFENDLNSDYSYQFERLRNLYETRKKVYENWK